MSHRLAAFHSQCQWIRNIRILYHSYGDGDSNWAYTASRELLFISMFPKTMVSTLLSVNIFTGRHVPPPPLRVHINGFRSISIHITESKIYISNFKNHDSTLMLSSIIFTCHPFQPSSISLLRVGNTFRSVLFLMLLNYKKIILRSHRLAAFHY